MGGEVRRTLNWKREKKMTHFNSNLFALSKPNYDMFKTDGWPDI